VIAEVPEARIKENSKSKITVTVESPGSTVKATSPVDVESESSTHHVALEF
jgi:hypothetical protein